eukprot:121167_1
MDTLSSSNQKNANKDKEKSLNEIYSADAKQEETPELANLSIDDKQEINQKESSSPAKSNGNNDKQEASDGEDGDESDEESESDESEMYAGLNEEDKKKMKEAMGAMQSDYNKHCEAEKVRDIKETQQEFGFNLAITITEEEAEFISSFCTEQNINLSEKLQEEGTFFLESMREMLEQKKAIGNLSQNDSDEEEDDREESDDDDEDWVIAEKRKKEQRKRQRAAKGLKKNTNLNGKTRCGRLLLNEALKDVSKMEGWSEARKKAWMTRKTNPNSYFYRFNVPGQPQRNGKWSKEEHKLFMQQVAAIGVNLEWGIYSKKIPGRVGYQCSNYWRGLVKDGYVRDPNHKIVTTDTGAKKLHFKRNIPSFAISPEYRRFAITVVRDSSGIWKDLPKKHSKHPSDSYMKTVNQHYSGIDIAKKNYNKNKNNKNSQNTKKNGRKRKRKKNNDDSDEDWDYKPSKRRRRNNKDGDEAFNCSIKVSPQKNENDDNPMSTFIDIMTGAPVIKPA